MKPFQLIPEPDNKIPMENYMKKIESEVFTSLFKCKVEVKLISIYKNIIYNLYKENYIYVWNSRL